MKSRANARFWELFSYLPAEAIRVRVELLLKRGVACHAPKVSGMCREILDELAMWTFVYVDGVEPTNNFGERNLRP